MYNLTFDGELDFTNKPTWASRDYHRSKMVKSKTLPGDVLMNIVGPPLGKVSIVPETYPEWNINQAIARFRVLDGFGRLFLSLWLQSPKSKGWMSTNGQQTTSQINLSISGCRGMPVPLAPYAEQDQIVDLVAARFALAGSVGKRLDEQERDMNTLDQAILAKAFRGELVPQDPTDEPASVLLERIRAERAGRPRRHKARAPRLVSNSRAASFSEFIPENDQTTIEEVLQQVVAAQPDSDHSLVAAFYEELSRLHAEGVVDLDPSSGALSWAT